MTGIQINLISREKLAAMTPEQRIRFIVDEIKAGKVLVLERGLTAKEELELIRTTMAEIDHKSFIGVETPGFSIDLKKRGLLNRIFGQAPPPRMMVVGPAQLLQTIKKDGEMVQTMIVTKDSMGKMSMENVIEQQKAADAKGTEMPKEPEEKPLPAPPSENGIAPPKPGPPQEAGEAKGPEKPPEAKEAPSAPGQAGPAAPGPESPQQEPAAPKKPEQNKAASDLPEEPEEDEDKGGS